MAVIGIEGVPVETSWYDLYAATVAVNSMCVSKRKQGAAFIPSKASLFILTMEMDLRTPGVCWCAN